MNPLIFRADDAGSSHSANRAILECVRRGVVRNVSFMVPGPAFESAVERFCGLKNVDFGLHVTLNAEWDRVRWGPVLHPRAVPSLVDEIGAFLPSPRHTYERGFSVDEAMAEIAEQLAYARSCGLRVDYLDEHMGVSWIGLRPPLEEFARREGLVYAPDLAPARGLPDAAFADAPTAFDEGEGAPPDEREPRLVVTHPSFDTAEMRMVGNREHPGERVARERDAERRWLTDPRLADWIVGAGTVSLRYRELGAATPVPAA